VSRSKRLCKAGDTHVPPVTKSQSTSQVSFATLLKYSTDVLPHERSVPTKALGFSLRPLAKACLVRQQKSHGWTTAVNLHPGRRGGPPQVLGGPAGTPATERNRGANGPIEPVRHPFHCRLHCFKLRSSSDLFIGGGTLLSTAAPCYDRKMEIGADG
jgi:hypothetical protein